MEAKVFKEHLEKNLIPFWNKLKGEKKTAVFTVMSTATMILKLQGE